VAEIRVTTQELTRMAEELEKMNSVFCSEILELRVDEALLSTSYEDDSQKQFHIQFSSDVEKFEQFYQTIQQFIQQLRTNADTYDKAEAANVSIAMARK